MTLHTGRLPDHPAVVAARPKFHLHPDAARLRSAQLPTSTANRSRLLVANGGPGILNQGQTGSCEGHAHAAATTLFFALRGTPIPLVSPVGWYQGALMLQRQPKSDGTLPYLSDDGTTAWTILQAASLFGVASAQTYGLYPANPATITKEPELLQLEAEQAFVLGGAYFINSIGDQRCFDVMACLAAGIPVTMALAASGPDFQGYHGGVLGVTSGPIDHANYFVDYEWDGANLGSLVLHCVNSWGVGWGEPDSLSGASGGTYRANRFFLAQAEDLCVMDLIATGVEQ